MWVRNLIGLLFCAFVAVVLMVPAGIKAADDLAKQPSPVDEVDPLEPMGSIGNLTQPLSASTKEVASENKKKSSEKELGTKKKRRGMSKRRMALGVGLGLILLAAAFFLMKRRSRVLAVEDAFPVPLLTTPEIAQGTASSEVKSVEGSVEQEGEPLSSSQYQELSDEMKELEAKLERIDALEAQLREKIEAQEQEEAVLARMDEITQRLESIEGRMVGLSDDQQLAAAKMSTKSEALASRFGELEWHFGEIVEKQEEREKNEAEDGSANLLERLGQLEVQLKALEETPVAETSKSTEDAESFLEVKQATERNERVLRALAVKVARMSGDSSKG